MRGADYKVQPRQESLKILFGSEGYLIPGWESIDRGTAHLCSKHYYWIKTLKPLAYLAMAAAAVYLGKKAYKSYTDSQPSADAVTVTGIKAGSVVVDYTVAVAAQAQAAASAALAFRFFTTQTTTIRTRAAPAPMPIARPAPPPPPAQHVYITPPCAVHVP